MGLGLVNLRIDQLLHKLHTHIGFLKIKVKKVNRHTTSHLSILIFLVIFKNFMLYFVKF